MDLDDSVAFGLGFGYNYSSKWSVETDLRYTPTETDNGSSSDVDIWTISLGALNHLSPESKFNPYLSFGVGLMVYDFDTAGSSDDEDVFGYLGGGIKYALSDSTDFRVDLRELLDYRSDNKGAIHDDSKWRHHFQAMAGLTFALGGKAAAPAPMKKEPVAKAAPVDSDKDGVFDPQDQCPGTAPGIRVDSVGCPADSDGDGVADFKDACVNTPRGTKVDEYGCPKAAKEVASLTLNILFGVDKDQVTPFHGAELKKAAAFIKKYPMYKVVVEGHTDSQGAAGYNLGLSQRRAASVRDALINRYGFSGKKIRASGFGESQPVADNASAEGRLKNRRVEISIRP
jgi:OOP family OmpA-OmpF porin